MTLRDRAIAGEFVNRWDIPYLGIFTDRSKWEADIGPYFKEDDRLKALFKEEALREVGMEFHPSREFMYGMAVEMGESDGATVPYLEVLEVLVKLAELVNQVKKDELVAK